MKTSRALLGVLAGMAAGAAFGILFAPAKGERTRRNISRKGEELMDDLEELVDDRLNANLSKLTGKIKSCNCGSARTEATQENATSTSK